MSPSSDEESNTEQPHIEGDKEYTSTDDVFERGPIGSSDTDSDADRTVDTTDTDSTDNTTEAHLPHRGYPDHIERVHKALIGLRNRLKDERFYSEDRDELTTEIGYLFAPIDRLTVPDAEFSWIEPYEKPTADELAEIVDQKIALITPDSLTDWPVEPEEVQPILEEVENVHDHIDDMDKFPYAYTELEVKERYGKENLISIGIPDNVPDEEAEEEWYAGLRGVNAMCQVPRRNPNAALHIGTDTRTGYDISIDKQNLFVHRAIFGQTGKGKSTLLTNNFRALMETDAGGCFIDPKGDDSLRLLQILPEDRLDDIIWIEPGAAGNYISGFNFISTNVSPDAPHYDTIVSNLVEDMVKVLSAEDTWHTRMDRIARTLITVMNEYNRRTPDDILDLNFVDMYYILKDEGSRHEFRALIEQTDIQFKSEYLDDIAEMEDDMLEPLLGRFLKWIQENTARQMIGFREESINISEAVEDDKIIIVRMGMENKRLKKMVGTAIIRRIWSHIRSRANQQRHDRDPFYLFCDEFDNLVLQDDTIETMFSESRSYKLSLNAAMQYPGQVRSEVMDGVLNNAKTIHGYNPGRAKSAKAYNTELGVDVDTLTAEADFHQWMRLDTNDGMERSDAFRVYTHPPFPPLRSRERAEEIRQEALKEHGREIPTKETEKSRLLFNEGKGRWESGEGQRLKMADDEQLKLEMMQQLLMQALDPDGLPIRNTSGGELHNSSTSGVTMSDAANEFDLDGDEDAEISYTEETLDNILEATFSVRVQNGYDPSEMIPLEVVRTELENRHGDLGYVNKLGNVLERFPDELLVQGTVQGEMAIRLTPDGRRQVLSHDSGADSSAGGVKHRHLCGEAFIMASVLGYQASVPSQEAEGELPDATGEPPIDLTRGDTLTETRELIAEVEEKYPAVAQLTDGKPLTMEIETSTFEKPIRTITNLRKAVNAGRYCLFVVSDGSHSDDVPKSYKDDSFAYYAKRVERLFYNADYNRAKGDYDIDRSEVILAAESDANGNRRFYNDADNHRTVENHRILRPKPDGRGDTKWVEEGDDVVARGENDKVLARFESHKEAMNPPLSKVTYLEQKPAEDEWVVRDGSDKHVFGSEGEAMDEWSHYKAPYIPDTEFDEWPTANDFGIVIMPDDDNDRHDQPQLYVEGELYPIYDSLGEDLEPPAVKIGDVEGSPTEKSEDTESSEGNTDTEATETVEDSGGSQLPFCPKCTEQDWSGEGRGGGIACGSCTYQPPNELQEEIAAALSTESDEATIDDTQTQPDAPETAREAHKQEAGAMMDTQEAADPVNKPDDPDQLDTDHRKSGPGATETDSEPTDDSDLVGGDDDAFEQGNDSYEPSHIVGPKELSPAELSQQMKPHLTESDIDEIEDRAYEVFERDGPPNDEHKIEHEVLSNYYDPDEHGTLIDPDEIPDEASPTERPETATLTNAELRNRLPLTEEEQDQIGDKIEGLTSGTAPMSVDEAERQQLLEYYDPDEHDLRDSGESESSTESEKTVTDPSTANTSPEDDDETNEQFMQLAGRLGSNTECSECDVEDWYEHSSTGQLACGHCDKVPKPSRQQDLRAELDRF